MDIQVISISEKKCGCFDVYTWVDAKPYVFQVQVELINLGKYEIQNVSHKRQMWDALQHNLQLISQIHHLVLDVYNEREMTLPIRITEPQRKDSLLQEELDELAAERRAFAAYQEWPPDPSTAKPWEEVKAELIAEGLMDEDEKGELAVVNA